MTINNNSHNIKFSQQADDTTLILKNKPEIADAITIIEEFGTYSGLKLNKNKTEGLWLGKRRISDTKFHDIQFKNDYVKALGVYFGHDDKLCLEKNWNDKVEEVKNLINLWNRRKLTFYGKITIIKSTLLPKFTYLMQSTETPTSIINLLNTLFYKFLWNNKSEKIKRLTLIGDKTKGGLEMVDLDIYQKTLKMKWIKSLTDTQFANWKLIPQYFFKPVWTKPFDI